MKTVVMAVMTFMTLMTVAREASEADVRRRNACRRQVSELEAKRNALKDRIRLDLEMADTLNATAELMEGVRKVPPKEVERLSEKFAYEESEPKTIVKTEKDKSSCVHRWITLEEGGHYRFQAEVQAENVKGTGIKFGLMVPMTVGDTRWPSASVGLGTFDWRPVAFDYILPSGATKVLLLYGLEGGSGKVSFRKVTVSKVDRVLE